MPGRGRASTRPPDIVVGIGDDGVIIIVALLLLALDIVEGVRPSRWNDDGAFDDIASSVLLIVVIVVRIVVLSQSMPDALAGDNSRHYQHRRPKNTTHHRDYHL